MTFQSKKSIETSIAVAVAAVASLVLTLIAPSQAHAVGTPHQEQLRHAQMIAAVFDQHNVQRRAHGLAPLVFSPSISLRLSQPFTHELANRNSGLWHNSGTKIGAEGGWWGENVASGYSSETAAQLVKRWMDSPGHRQNIVNSNYTTMAIGFAQADNSSTTYSTVNLFRGPTNPGPTYATGAAWLASLNTTDPSVNIYLTEGYHTVNGRQWHTDCEPYSQTQRCTTQIWGTQIKAVGSTYVKTNSWTFNNLTYAPSPRSLWAGNPLGGNGVVNADVRWVDGGRSWRTECDTATTGRNGCRSYVMATIIEEVGGSYRTVTREVFNNMVLFS